MYPHLFPRDYSWIFLDRLMSSCSAWLFPKFPYILSKRFFYPSSQWFKCLQLNWIIEKWIVLTIRTHFFEEWTSNLNIWIELDEKTSVNFQGQGRLCIVNTLMNDEIHIIYCWNMYSIGLAVKKQNSLQQWVNQLCNIYARF